MKPYSLGNSCRLNDSLDGLVGIFFINKDELLLHTCKIADGEPYGDFVNYPESHNDVWQREYADKHRVDFDYFPRGRIVYNKAEDVFLLYYDKCADREAKSIRKRYPKGKCNTALDEHYQCHMCNDNYVK